MTRDMELVKLILEKIEKECTDSAGCMISPKSFPEYSASDVNGHALLILERGLANGKMTSGGVAIVRLTWEGHDFLDNSRNSTVWQTTMKAAGGLSFGVFLRVLENVATKFALKNIGL
ncbi:MAG: DUF2513 domain-containing protein [Thermoguttaceae bacterium]|nr:DUF2513 domain-containing protein [Thermoguttaceae bacterium]